MSDTSTAALLAKILDQLTEIHKSEKHISGQITGFYKDWNNFVKSNSVRQIQERLSAPRYSESRRLEHFGYKVFSQAGQDGIIQEIFQRIGTTDKRFVEFGVGTGAECNTNFLLYLGWNGLWIDGDEQKGKLIEQAFINPIRHNALTFRRATITRENINQLIGEAGFEGEIDFLSVDIDGNDYHVMKAIEVIRPRALVIECNAAFRPPIDFVTPYDPTYRWDGSVHGGASLAALARMLAEKGYVLVGTEICGIDAFFVRQEFADRFVYAGDVASLHNPPGHWIIAGYPVSFPAPKVMPWPTRE